MTAQSPDELPPGLGAPPVARAAPPSVPHATHVYRDKSGLRRVEGPITQGAWVTTVRSRVAERVLTRRHGDGATGAHTPV